VTVSDDDDDDDDDEIQHAPRTWLFIVTVSDDDNDDDDDCSVRDSITQI